MLGSGCEMIALDGTLRRRPKGEQFADLVGLIQQHKVLAMADISTAEEALAAQEVGVDCVSTTLSGYTSYTPKLAGPDFDLIVRLAQQLKVPLLAEGRINTPADLLKAYQCGAYSAVVGSAITRPQLITAGFVRVLK